jgi:hypothetical protein
MARIRPSSAQNAPAKRDGRTLGVLKAFVANLPKVGEPAKIGGEVQ